MHTCSFSVPHIHVYPYMFTHITQIHVHTHTKTDLLCFRTLGAIVSHRLKTADSRVFGFSKRFVIFLKGVLNVSIDCMEWIYFL